VAALGEEEREGGWLSPLHEALYPAKERWRNSEEAPGCPPFGWSTVLNRPPEYEEEVSVKPGLHRPKAGAHGVVWFDPLVAKRGAVSTEGVENEQVLNGTAQQAADGLRVYEEWRGKRATRIAEGSVPRIRTKVAQSVSRAEEAEGIVVETVTLPAVPGRPAGRKFGLVVHEILQRAEGAEEIEGLAAVWGRRHGASEQEIAAAGEAARAALAAIVAPEGATRYREMPVMVRLEDGTIVDGRVDCAWSDGTQWVVIDYKTDRREKRNVAQVQLYGLALQRATGLPARGVVLEV